MTFFLSLSTSVCSGGQSPQATFEQWRSLVEGAPLATHAAIDARRAPAFQDELLAVFRQHGFHCSVLTDPLVTDRGCQAAPTISEDRDAQRTAKLQLLRSLRRAFEHEVAAVVLLPGQLLLTPSVEVLALRFAAGRALSDDRLQLQRAALAQRAMDPLLRLLDVALEQAARQQVQLLLPGPCPWPHQLPGVSELLGVLQAFDGAPLSSTYFADWTHCRAVLGYEQYEESPTNSQPTAFARIGDVSGLMTGLPLGSGELSEQAASPALAAAHLELALGDGCLPDEVQRSLQWILAQRRGC